MQPDKSKYQSKSHTFLKGEAFIAALIRQGYSFEKLVIERTGSFTKSYRKDVEDVRNKTDDQDNPYLHLKINRDSIYDRLPEGLFHQPRAHGSATAAVQQMVGEYKRFREEEKAARRFFQPLEQEMFRYAVFVEQEEQEMLWALLSGNMSSGFAKFWNLEEDLPAEATSALVRLMPWAYRIKGDKELCAKALEMLLDRPVSVVDRIIREHFKDDDTFLLGDNELGTNTVTGSSVEEPALSWVFTIGEMSGQEIAAFVGDKPYARLLQQFVDIFIPLEIDATFEYEVEGSNEEIAERILGYSFIL